VFCAASGASGASSIDVHAAVDGMIHEGSLALSVLGTFVATNVDDFVLLLLLFSGAPRRREIGRVIAGQFIAFTGIVATAWVASLAALSLPSRLFALLGLVPIGLGVVALFDTRQSGESLSPPRLHPTMLGVVGLTLSLGTENIAVYTAFFATLGPARSLLVGCAYLVLLAGLCAVALATARAPILRRVLERVLVPLTPYLYIGMGALLLARSLLGFRH
jgi:cadmium resistance protein CadD (predicted permease)